MFLRYLNAEQQQSFLALARRLCMTDWRYAVQEWDRIAMLQREMGLPDAQVGNTATSRTDEAITTLIAPFVSHRDRVILLLELLTLGYADHTFDPNESAFIGAVAHAVEMSAADLHALQDWAQRYTALMNEAHQLFGQPS